jgi:hypothetical protein
MKTFPCIACATPLAPPYSACPSCDGPDVCAPCPICACCAREDHGRDPMHLSCSCSVAPMTRALRVWAADLSEHVGA